MDILGELPVTPAMAKALKQQVANKTLPGVVSACLVRAFMFNEDPTVVALMVGLTGHADTAIRREALYSLSTSSLTAPGLADTFKLADAFIEAAKDEDPEVRALALHGISCLPDVQVNEVCKDVLAAHLEDRDPDARASAIFGLSMSADRRGPPPISSRTCLHIPGQRPAGGNESVTSVNRNRVS